MSFLNQSVFLFIHNLSGRNVFLDDLGVFFAQYLPYLLVIAFLVLVWYEDGWRKKLYVFCEGAISVILARGIVTEVIRFFYHSVRPFAFYNFMPLINESGWSFPSGHMTWFFALSLAVWYANHKWGWWFFALSALIGIARIFAGVHWPTDIVGGAIIGLAVAWLVHWALKSSREKLYVHSATAAQ